MKVNPTLTTLNIGGEQQQPDYGKQGTTSAAMNKAGYGISGEGARVLSEALKANTTLATLLLEREATIKQRQTRTQYELQ